MNPERSELVGIAGIAQNRGLWLLRMYAGTSAHVAANLRTVGLECGRTTSVATILDAKEVRQASEHGIQRGITCLALAQLRRAYAPRVTVRPDIRILSVECEGGHISLTRVSLNRILDSPSTNQRVNPQI
jgi:hypothetical protein